MAVTRDDRRLYVANVWGQRVSEIDLTALTNRGDIVVGTGTNEMAGGYHHTGQVDADVAAVTKRAAAARDPEAADAPFPYACALDERRHRLYVSLWSRACLAVIDLNSREVTAYWPTQEHPNEMVLSRSRRQLYVANANRNTVSIIDTSSGKTIETLDASLTPGAPPGSTPNSLALSPDQTKLFVANAGNNCVAVFDVSSPAHAAALGFIPVGKYPTSVRVTPDGRRLLVAAGKRPVPMANPEGPQPNKRGDRHQYIADLVPGALSIIDLPKGGDWKTALAGYTREANEGVPRHGAPAAAPSPDNPIPTAPGQSSPIKYCVYIIKENRTYDQVFGDDSRGNGDPKLCLFPDKVTPNHHKLTHDFVLFDNFYVDAEVSAGGHEWSTAAYSSDFVEKNWPLNYGHNRSKKYPYPAEGGFPAAYPASGYIWDRAAEAGVSYRSFGEFVYTLAPLTSGTASEAARQALPKVPYLTRMPGLQGHFDPFYHGFDINYPDVSRAARFISELKKFEAEGEMPLCSKSILWQLAAITTSGCCGVASRQPVCAGGRQRSGGGAGGRGPQQVEILAANCGVCAGG